MFGLPIIDLVVIVLYFAVVILIGIWSMRRIRNQDDFFLAGRRSGKIIQTFAAFGQGTSTDNAVGVTTTTFTNGAGGIWSSLLLLFATPMYWITSPWFRRLRVRTMGDFFEDRYGSKKIAATYAVIGCFSIMATIAIGFSAMTKTIVAMIPKEVYELNEKEMAEYNTALEFKRLKSIDYSMLTIEEKEQLSQLELSKPRKLFPHFSESAVVWIVCLIVMIYAVAGGLEAAFLSDTLQGFFIIILSIMLLPFAYGKINAIYGGHGIMDALKTIHDKLPESFFDLFGSPSCIDFTWYYITAISIMFTINVVMNPNMLLTIAAAKDEFTARFGFTSGNFIKRFCTILWGLLGLAAIVLYADKVQNSDLVWGYSARDLLGSLNIGLVGLMIACLMAALMSTADCLMITASSLIILNLYRPFTKAKSEEHYILVGRVAGAVVVIGGAVIATQFDNILQMLKFTWEFNIVVAASFWLGMKWRRANRKAAWSSILVTLFVFLLGSLLTPVLFPSLRANPYLLKMTNPKPLERIFTAHEQDVENRTKEIQKWHELNQQGLAEGPKPKQIQVGEKFIKTDRLPSKGIFWTQGIKYDSELRKYGSGMINLELILVDKLGFPLEKNAYAMNETIRVIIRAFTPFLILILVVLATRPDDKKLLDRFYAKMKTKVSSDAEKDKMEMELSLKNPQRFDHKKLFPNSNWELYKWNKEDILGFLAAVGVLLFIIFALMFIVNFGG